MSLKSKHRALAESPALFEMPPRPILIPKPPLKWAGGKRWLVPTLKPLWEPYAATRLVEPFCGGLAVALGLRPKKAMLNDVNDHLINFYMHLQSGFQPKIKMSNDSVTYYAARARFNELNKGDHPEPAERAALFYYLNRTGFNGLCRFNRAGGFNVPFGSYETINYTTDFSSYKEVFKDWTFLHQSFRDIPIRPSDFIYADPPYDVEFTAYSKEPFPWKKQRELAEWLAAHDGPVVLSNQATDRILALYKTMGFKITLYDAPRRISCNGDRKPAKEVLATRNL